MLQNLQNIPRKVGQRFLHISATSSSKDREKNRHSKTTFSDGAPVYGSMEREASERLPFMGPRGDEAKQDLGHGDLLT